MGHMGLGLISTHAKALCLCHLPGLRRSAPDLGTPGPSRQQARPRLSASKSWESLFASWGFQRKGLLSLSFTPLHFMNSGGWGNKGTLPHEREAKGKKPSHSTRSAAFPKCSPHENHLGHWWEMQSPRPFSCVGPGISVSHMAYRARELLLRALDEEEGVRDLGYEPFPVSRWACL